MDISPPFEKLAIALVLGLLVGLQRESHDVPEAGVRTFAVATLFGAAAASLAEPFGPWFVAAGMLALAMVAVGGQLMRSRRDTGAAVDPGLTTEVALLAMYAVGAWVVVGPTEVAVAAGATIAILLHFKAQLHEAIDRLGERDLRAIMLFAALSALVLPLLPDRAFGPYDAFNPYETWLMVVLVVGINLGGYIAYRTLGERAGIVVGGALGGLVSSTATTVGYSRMARQHPQTLRAATVVLLMASCFVYPRLAIELAIVHPPLLPTIAPWIGGVFAASVGVVVFAWRRSQHDAPSAALPEQKNPGQLRVALAFGVLYALISFAMAAAEHHLGTSGVYAVAGVSGLTDVDAVTLSAARLARTGTLHADETWRVALIAATSNLVFKAGVAGVLGTTPLFRRVAVGFGILAAISLALVAFVPRGAF